MTARTILIVAALALAVVKPDHDAQAGSLPEGFEISGYLPYYRESVVDNIDFSMLTDVLVFSIVPNADGTLNTQDVSTSFLNKVKQRAGDAKVRITVGGGGRSEHFWPMTGDAATRATFVNNLTQYVLDHNLDGADINWEHPGTHAQHEAAADLVQELRAAFDEHTGLELSVAVPGWHGAWRERAYQALDRVNVMSYDNGYPMATVQAFKNHIGNQLNWNVARDQMMMGVPFYGRNEDAHALTYSQIVDLAGGHPDSDMVDGYSFNSAATLEEKVRIIQDEQLRGIMIWELGQDTFDDNSLLHAVHREAVPEPTSGGVLLGGIAFLLLRRSRTRTTASQADGPARST